MNNEGMQNFDANQSGDFDTSDNFNTPAQSAKKQAISSPELPQANLDPQDLPEIIANTQVEKLQPSEQPDLVQTPAISPVNNSTTPLMPPSMDPSSPMLTPEKASDQGKIEREWVDQTEKTIKIYQDDPKRLEEAYEELQNNYLKKRFNRAIGDRNT